MSFNTLGKDIDVFSGSCRHPFDSREALSGRMIPRSGIGLKKSVCRVCVLAAMVVADTGRLCKPVPCARLSRIAFNAGIIKVGVVWTKSTACL